MTRYVWCIACLLLVVGCSTPTHTWPDQDRGMVWTAMIAAAKAPDYASGHLRKRWIVAENNVNVDADRGHIRIHRVLTRSLVLPEQKVQHDHRKWLFDIYLLPGFPPRVSFDALNVGLIPAQMHTEADRYFLLVDSLLHHPVN